MIAGTDYSFVIDNEEQPLPDPRTRFQPYGVHGVSRIVDHGEFKWTDQHFVAPPLSDAAIYELHVGTFTPGRTFDSAIENLDHLVELGITHVELMPIAEFSGSRGWGYDGVDLFAPHHAYGGPDGLKRLVDACHAKGLAVILDVVYNHFGPSGNNLPRFGPYFTDRYATPWGSAINLDGRGSDEVRRFFCDNAISWMRDYHIDGLRLDAVHAIRDVSPLNLLEQLATEIADLARQTERRLVLIAEDDLNDPRVVTRWIAAAMGWTRSGMRISITPCIRSSRVRIAVTIRISESWGSSRRRCVELLPTRASTPRIAIGGMADRLPGFRGTISLAACKITIR